MIYSVHFQSENKSRDVKTVNVPNGMSLTVAASEAGFPLRTDCGGAGTCGKCKVNVDGYERLACQTTVQSNLEVSVPESALRNEKTVAVQTKSFLDDGIIKGAGRAGHCFGVAVDIGTTTLAAELYAVAESRLLATASRVNPQRNFGDDVITRIQKVIEEPAFLAKLQNLIVGAVNEMIEELAAKAGIAVTDVSLVSTAGNTVMEHLFLGIDPSPLGFVPFEAPIAEYPVCLGSDIGLNIASDGILETLPIFGGFVGGDIVAGILTLIQEPEGGRPRFLQGTSFFIDIGTNGELVLSHNGNLYTAATAAGPAFEGGRIEYGTLAVPGAIDKVELKLQAAQQEPGGAAPGVEERFISTIGGHPPIGICGSGLIDTVSELLRHGLIKPSGQFNVKADSPFLRFWKMIDGKPSFELASLEVSGLGEPILLTQRDIRQLQLAAGAIRAGIRLLLQQQGLRTEDIETFYVAGGFGSFIRPEAARRIGLIPNEIPLERIRFCGNTSLAGARLTLLDSRCHNEARSLTRCARSIELASLPDFANIYAESMMF
jgi:uncharacterized 2Fe-2S/4Fe-4S cluster protein (DUF4445 family)